MALSALSEAICVGLFTRSTGSDSEATFILETLCRLTGTMVALVEDGAAHTGRLYTVLQAGAGYAVRVNALDNLYAHLSVSFGLPTMSRAIEASASATPRYRLLCRGLAVMAKGTAAHWHVPHANALKRPRLWEPDGVTTKSDDDSASCLLPSNQWVVDVSCLGDRFMATLTALDGVSDDTIAATLSASASLATIVARGYGWSRAFELSTVVGYVRAIDLWLLKVTAHATLRSATLANRIASALQTIDGLFLLSCPRREQEVPVPGKVPQKPRPPMLPSATAAPALFALTYGTDVTELAFRCLTFATSPVRTGHDAAAQHHYPFATMHGAGNHAGAAAGADSAAAATQVSENVLREGTQRALYAAAKSHVASSTMKGMMPMHAIVACAALRILARQASGGQLSFGGRADDSSGGAAGQDDEDDESDITCPNPACVCPFQRVKTDVAWQACNVKYLQSPSVMRLLSSLVMVRARERCGVHTRVTIVPFARVHVCFCRYSLA